MAYWKQVCISGSVFWGWKTMIDLNTVCNMKEFVDSVKNKLTVWIIQIESFTGQDLHGLKRAYEELNLSCHGNTFE